MVRARPVRGVDSLEGRVPDQLAALVQPHIESYNYFVGEGMERLFNNLKPVEVDIPLSNDRFRFWLEKPQLGNSHREEAPDVPVLPRECREGRSSYRAPFSFTFCFQGRYDNHPRSFTKRVGLLPIMVKSSKCHLRRMTCAQLVQAGEEANETGGYFICNGNERLVRLLVQNRRHHIFALRRSPYTRRGRNFTSAACTVRCVRSDESSLTTRCHYLADGSVTFALPLRRTEYFVPAGVLLRALAEVSDRELYSRLAASAGPDAGHAAFVADRAEILLQQVAKENLNTPMQALEYLGRAFRVALRSPAYLPDHEVGSQLVRDHFLVHLSSLQEKYDFAVEMISKLYALANNQCCEDNVDSLAQHELLLPGHALLKLLKEQLEVYLEMFAAAVRRDVESNSANLENLAYVRSITERMPDIGKKFEYFLNTGNMLSRTGLDLGQTSGFTIVAEKLNYHRYISHFRSVHRGAFFVELRTTTVRKLLPESWGFMCPVHTPDGGPCGLLNHLTAMCQVVPHGPEEPEVVARAICETLEGLGMQPIGALPTTELLLPVMLDGKVVGCMSAKAARSAVSHLRSIKAATLAKEQGLTKGANLIKLYDREDKIPSNIEVVYLAPEKGGPHPGILVHTQGSRMIRPVKQLASGAAEMIGTLEQTTLRIRCPDGGAGGSQGIRFTHAEFGTSAMLSVVASLTPYSDFNQSPRNMYQCQMAKQTMGTPMQAIQYRPDNKIYRIHSPQTPLAQTVKYNEYCMDEYPSGTNAIVAVLAFTGYDMEDAMILNKSSVDRGFAHASVYKTEAIDLKGSEKRLGVEKIGKVVPFKDRVKPVGAFGAQFPQMIASDLDSKAVKDGRLEAEGNHRNANTIDVDGLPHVGGAIWPGEAVYNLIDTVTGKAKMTKQKGEETAVVDSVTVAGGHKETGVQKVNIRTRYNRNPVIGDKFSSRHGQKGVLSQLYEDVDMPFNERTGMRPDLLINPHAFPSRMTIGMLIESLTGKAGALTCRFVNSTPFQASDGVAVDAREEMGQALEAAGFAKNGGETLINGITGEPFHVDIYMGCVYYQRLRHMASDKIQARSTGPINPLTKQPIKGRKLGGGIRMGEMERDSILAHGASYLLHERLHLSSDYSVANICTECGLIMSTASVPVAGNNAVGLRASLGAHRLAVTCRLCESGKHIERVAVPSVMVYLFAELQSMNIRCSLDVV